jgi:hypothetical protein
MSYYVHLDAQELGEELWAAWGGPAAGNNKAAGNSLGNNGPQAGQEAVRGFEAGNLETPCKERL